MLAIRNGYYSPACTGANANLTLLGVSCFDVVGGNAQGGLSSSLAFSFSVLSDLQKENANPSDPTTINNILQQIISVRAGNQVLLVQELLNNFSSNYNEVLQTRFTRVAQTSLWINLILLACLTSFFLAGWALFMLKFQSRIKSCKDVLSLLPAMILTQNMRVAKFLQEILHDISRGTN